ncbi:MAG: glycosyltransferase family 4 protein [Verrucomicrobiales bacterium]
MKLLFINRVYPPAEGATGFLLQELAEGLAAQGHEVTVITSGLATAGESIPTQTSRSVSPQTVKVVRVAGLPFTRASHLKRAMAYLSLYPAFFLKAASSPRPDLIVTMTDPPLQLVLGPFLKIFKRCTLVHWAQDVYPELAEELGVLPKGGFPARILRFSSTWAMKRYNRVIAVGRCMRDRLIRRGVAPDKIVVIPNWAQEGMEQGTRLATQIEDFRKAHGLSGKFVAMYSGNFGLAHDFTAVVQAAPRLAKEAPHLQFVFVGGGPRYAWLQEQLRGLPNVQFLPFQPKETLQVSLGAADVHLASMRDDLNGLVVPSKIYGILAAGRPCLFLGPGMSEAGLFIQENHCGAAIAPQDGEALIQTMKHYMGNQERCKTEGANALKAIKLIEFSGSLTAFQQLFLELKTK